MYSEICDAMLKAEEGGADFDDLRLSIHPDTLGDLMIQMGANSSLLNSSMGRPTRFGQMPIIEDFAQSGWAVIVDNTKGPET